MSIRGLRGVGIPVVLMHEGEGLIVTIETKSGHSYRGMMETTEDNMNTSLNDVVVTDSKGRMSKLDRVFIRGSQIVFVIFPDMLGQAPMFKRVALASQGITVAGGLGRGRQAAIGAKVAKTAADAMQGGRGGPGGPMMHPGGGFAPPPFGGGGPPGYGGGGHGPGGFGGGHGPGPIGGPRGPPGGVFGGGPPGGRGGGGRGFY